MRRVSENATANITALMITLGLALIAMLAVCLIDQMRHENACWEQGYRIAIMSPENRRYCAFPDDPEAPALVPVLRGGNQ